MLNAGAARARAIVGRGRSAAEAGPKNPTPPPHDRVKPSARPRKIKRGLAGSFSAMELKRAREAMLKYRDSLDTVTPVHNPVDNS